MRIAASIVTASFLAIAANAHAQTARRELKAGTEVAVLELKLIANSAAKLVGEHPPREIPLNAIKPTTVRKVPDGTTGARFATLTFGLNDAGKPARYAVMVTADTVRIDANLNSDLSDDAPIPTQSTTVKGVARRTGTFRLPLSHAAPPVEISFSAPDLSGANKSEPLMVTPNYALSATAKLGSTTYDVALIDGACDGMFAASKNPKVVGASFFIDRDVDGRNDGAGESFPIAQPFNIDGVTYELRDVDAPKASARVVVSQRRVEEINPPSDLRTGSRALAFDAKDIVDKPINFPGDFKDKVVLLDFWATWCGPCLQELPNVVETYNRYRKEGFEIIGVSLDDDPLTVRAFARQRKLEWPMICDGKKWNADIAKLYRVNGIPAMWLVDGDTGTILATGETLRGPGALERAVEAALVAKARERMRTDSPSPGESTPPAGEQSSAKP